MMPLLGLASLVACQVPLPNCVPLGGTVTLTETVHCPGPQDCLYTFDYTGGAFGVNNFVSYTPLNGIVSPPFETVKFDVTGLRETESPIWLEKTLIGCNASTSTIPCTTIVHRVDVAPTCP